MRTSGERLIKSWNIQHEYPHNTRRKYPNVSPLPGKSIPQCVRVLSTFSPPNFPAEFSRQSESISHPSQEHSPIYLTRGRISYKLSTNWNSQSINSRKIWFYDFICAQFSNLIPFSHRDQFRRLFRFPLSPLSKNEIYFATRSI